MNGFADAVRAKLPPSCLVDGTTSIDKSKCGASLAGVPDRHVIIDLDAVGSPLGHSTVKCDFLFVADPSLVMPIEVKDHGAPDIAKATRQLQAGADAAGKLAPRDVAVRFRPVLVSRGLRSHKRNELRGARVRFRKTPPEKVWQLICGDPLTEALGGS